MTMCDDCDIEWGRYDDDTLRGHYLIAAMDGRQDDQDLNGRELIRRGQLSEALHAKHMKTTRERKPLPRPIIAGPTDADLADRRQ
jgi:hypothetical protein